MSNLDQFFAASAKGDRSFLPPSIWSDEWGPEIYRYLCTAFEEAGVYSRPAGPIKVDAVRESYSASAGEPFAVVTITPSSLVVEYIDDSRPVVVTWTEIDEGTAILASNCFQGGGSESLGDRIANEAIIALEAIPPDDLKAAVLALI